MYENEFDKAIDTIPHNWNNWDDHTRVKLMARFMKLEKASIMNWEDFLWAQAKLENENQS